MKLTMHDHDQYLRACADPRATDAERETLSYCAAMAAAGEPVSAAQYRHCEALTGAALSREGSIYTRPHRTADAH